MSMWDRDIIEYCQSREKEKRKVEGILIRKGWELQNYNSSMKDSLFEWLDQWYTLSIKNLPTPATSYRSNPTKTSSKAYRHMTRLPGGWLILTSYARGKFLTQVLRDGSQFAKIDRSKSDADETHMRLVERIINDQSQSL